MSGKSDDSNRIDSGMRFVFFPLDVGSESFLKQSSSEILECCSYAEIGSQDGVNIQRNKDGYVFLFLVATSYTSGIKTLISTLKNEVDHTVLLILDSNSGCDADFSHVDAVMLPARPMKEVDITSAILDIVWSAQFQSIPCTDISDIMYILSKRTLRILFYQSDPFCKSTPLQNRLSDSEKHLIKKANKLLVVSCPSELDFSLDDYSYLANQIEGLMSEDAHVVNFIALMYRDTSHLTLILSEFPAN